MATPRPISAIRNSTTWLTLVISVRPPTSRKVASTEMPPMSIGSSARKLANTKARISSAPTPPIIDSTMRLVPLLCGAPFCSSCSPVTPVCQPAGAAVVRVRWIAGPRSGGLKFVFAAV